MQRGLKGRGLQNRQGSSRRTAKCPSRQSLSGIRKCDSGMGEGILDGNGGKDFAGEILLRIGMPMCCRSIRVENETWSWSTMARAGARRRPEIDGGGATHTDARRRMRDHGHSSCPARWRWGDTLLFCFFSTKHWTVCGSCLSKRTGIAPVCRQWKQKWDTVFLDANGYGYCMWPRLTDVNGSNYIERLCTTITIGIKSALKVLLLDKTDGHDTNVDDVV
jgi:hypothetical protein